MKITGKSSAEIFESVRSLVQSGQLPSGQPLPAVRDLAVALGVNRNTVASAYRRLTSGGIAIAQGRLGTTIFWQASPGEQEGASPGSPLVDLASGNPNPEFLADTGKLPARQQARPRLYGETTVDEELETVIRRWLDPDCLQPYEVNLTHGAVDAIERLAAAHLLAGDKVAVEEPCFLGTINALRVGGAQAVGVDVDEQGMRPEMLARALRAGAQAVLITPRVHNPTGCSLTEQRATALRDCLERFPNVLVIVDDHFALLADSVYHSVVPPSTKRWALVRSMSKALGPDLRMAFVASDKLTSQRLRLRLAPGMSWVSHLLQDLVSACLTSSSVARQVSHAKAEYAVRRRELQDALASQGIPVPTTGDGFNVWVPLQRDARELAQAMARRGWLVRSGDAFEVQAQSRALRITVSTLINGQARRLAADLRSCLDA
jgi:DNA-binding transcriptional MocR family regulator